MTGGARIERLVTSGTFSLDGGTWDVDNNVWLVGDDHEVIVVDAAHDADAILGALGGRTLRAIVCTHAHDDHIGAAPALAARTGAPVRPDSLWSHHLLARRITEHRTEARVTLQATPTT
ncbi:MBL fold metallo-hydrolase, partial [Streptomyces sp. NPDC005921]